MAGSVEVIPWNVDIRPSRPRGPMFRFLAWGKDSIFWANVVRVAGPPGTRLDGPIVGRSLYIPTLRRLNQGDVPVVVDDEIEGWVPQGTPAGEATSEALERVLDRLLITAWGTERAIAGRDGDGSGSPGARTRWLLDALNALGHAPCAPVWSPFHCRVAGDFVIRILSPTYRFSCPKP